MSSRFASLALHVAVAVASVPLFATACSTSSATTGDSGIAVLRTPACVANPVVGTKCTPSVQACSIGPCATMFCTSTGFWEEGQACAASSLDATTGSADAAHDASHADAPTGCGSFAAGAPCAPDGLSCALPGCATALCAGGTWVEERLCTEDSGAPVDGGHLTDGGHDAGHKPDSGRDAGDAHVDGSLAVASCASCSSAEMCIVSISQGGACFPHDGDVCSNGGTGTCCNTFTSYACRDLPAACTAGVTCACAGQYCGQSSPGCVNGTVDAGPTGHVLVCDQDNA